MHKAATSLANHQYYILSMAHLYKGLRAMGMLGSEWHDMDMALAAFGTKQPLVSKVGSQYDGEAAVRHYFMAMGVDSQNFRRTAWYHQVRAQGCHQRGTQDRHHLSSASRLE